MNQIRRKKLSYEIEITNKKRTNFHLLGRREKKREKKSIGDKPPYRQQQALHQITLHVVERLVWLSRGAIHVLTRNKHASTTLMIKKIIFKRENYQVTLHVLYITSFYDL